MLPSENTIFSFLIPEEKRGAVYGITSGACLIGNVSGPLCAGMLSLAFSINTFFWLTVLMFRLVGNLAMLFAKASYREFRP